MSGNVAIQLGFESMPPKVRPIEMQENRRIAFGRVVMPYFFRINPNDYSDITDQMVELASPDKLAPFLEPGTSRGDKTVDGRAVTSADYEILPRSITAFMRAVSNRAEKKAAIGGPDAQIKAAQEHSVKALQSKMEAMQKRKPVLEQSRDRLVKLDREAKYPGLAHFNSHNLFDMAYMARYGDFTSMFGVIGREKGWTSKQADLANRALDVRLFLLPQKEKIANWRAMNEMGIEYTSSVLEVYESRIRGVGLMVSRLDSHAQPAS